MLFGLLMINSTVYVNDLQRNAPWGLARISHISKLSFGTYSEYIYSANGGKGDRDYVLDTGINVTHNEFEVRVKWGITITANEEDCDNNGHGTHSAGVIASSMASKKKKAEPVAVKVLDKNGSGTMSDLLAGIHWTVDAHKKEKYLAGDSYKGAVANMSLGIGKPQSLERAINRAAEGGPFLRRCFRCHDGGASSLTDERAYFSNYGKCIDIFAPGLNVISTYIGDNNAAKPVLVLQWLLIYSVSRKPPNVTPKQIKQDILDLGTRGALTQVPDNTKNLLAFNGAENTST